MTGSNTLILQTNKVRNNLLNHSVIQTVVCCVRKTSFLKYYLSQIPRKSSYVVFGRDEKEFPAFNFVPLLQFEKICIESLASKIVVLDDAGAFKSQKTKVEDFFRFGRHHNIQVIYLAHYAKDVLPIVRERLVSNYT